VRVLLTGASGFLGRYILPGLDGHKVLPLHHSEPGPEGFVRADLTRPDHVAALFEKFSPDAVIHLAAMSKPDQCEKSVEAAEKVNVLATASLARVCAYRKARLIFFSTDMVFDGTRPPYRESDPVSPLGVYAQGKVRAEKSVRELCPDSVILRQSLSYGWNRPREPFFADWIYATLAAGKPARLFSDQVRTMFYAGDAGFVLSRLLERWEKVEKGVYHLAGPERLSRYEFGRKMCRVFGFDEGLISPEPMPAGGTPRPKDCSLDGTRLNAALDFSPTGADEALAAMKLTWETRN
jgi:dTDP-4-dehydrorhamnose reductase